MRVSSVIFLPSSGTFKSQRMSTLREKKGEDKGKGGEIRAAGVRRVRKPENMKNSHASARAHAGFDCKSPEFQQGLPAELIFNALYSSKVVIMEVKSTIPSCP
jgi:hypothetical protein